jgi:lipoprotein
MKLRVLLFLAATTAALAFSFSFSSCTDKDRDEIIKEIVAIDLTTLHGTWEGTYLSISSNISEEGTIEIKAGSEKNELIIDTRKIKGIKVKVTANTAALVNADAVKEGEVESGSLGYTKLGNLMILEIKTTESSTEKSFKFTSKTKK